MGLNKRVSDLGPEVQQIPLDDIRLRTIAPKAHKPERPAADDGGWTSLSPELEIKTSEQPIVSALVVEDTKEEPKKETPTQFISLPLRDDQPGRKPAQKKPFTKLLTPSSLSPSKGNQQNARKLVQSKNLRLFGIGAVVLLALIFGGFGLNYLINDLRVATATTASPTKTATSKPPIFTAIPLTPTPEPTQAVLSTPTLGIGSTMISKKDRMTLLYVPAGEFIMGSDSGESEERPVHTVYLDAFWIDQTEVTNKQYIACVDAGVCMPPSSANSHSHGDGYYGVREFDDYPVIYVSAIDASAYCLWVDRKLPTEAQWEKAARGTDARGFPWGNQLPDAILLNYSDVVGDTAKVGSYPSGVSPYGALDMAGNVWEWVNDWYDATYYQDSPASNPPGPDSGQYQVVRGGSWGNYFTQDISSVNRSRELFTVSHSYIGFRCARSP